MRFRTRSCDNRNFHVCLGKSTEFERCNNTCPKYNCEYNGANKRNIFIKNMINTESEKAKNETSNLLNIINQRNNYFFY